MHCALSQDFLIKLELLHDCGKVFDLVLITLRFCILLCNHEKTDGFLDVFRHITATCEGSHTKFTENVTWSCFENK